MCWIVPSLITRDFFEESFFDSIKNDNILKIRILILFRDKPLYDDEIREYISLSARENRAAMIEYLFSIYKKNIPDISLEATRFLSSARAKEVEELLYSYGANENIGILIWKNNVLSYINLFTLQSESR
jgi:hypothetical protein